MFIRSIVAVAALCAIGCTKSAVRGMPSPSPTTPASPAAALPPSGIHASATIRDASGARVGTASFADSYAGVLVSGNLTGLGLGAHGIHIHETGKCEAPFATAGGHFNPEHRKHGFSNPAGPHLGDLPNVDTPAAGTLRFEFLLPGVTLTGHNAMLDADGAAIVVHAGRDDYATDPAGNSGGRIACGVITAQP